MTVALTVSFKLMFLTFMIDRLWCSTDSLKDTGQRPEELGHNKVHSNSVECTLGLHVLLNLNVY